MSDRRIHITQGEHAVAQGADTMISTLLGSCVACCLWDDLAGVGGMNHMLLASDRNGSAIDTLAHINEIETLINALIKLGAQRARLKAKAFGGARMVSGLSDIGQQNAEFTLKYLASEGIPLVTHSLGGSAARNVRFWPATGKALQRVSDVSIEDEKPNDTRQDGNGIELF